MLYSRNPQELTVCRCAQPVPEKLREIVDATYCNSGVNKYSIKDGVCDVSLTFYIDSIHCCGGSFDAEKVKDCPFCGNPYPLIENDWGVTDISMG